jgi:uncharacterized damage-inducible protein DinB
VADEELGRVFIEQARHFLSIEYRTKLRHSVEALPPDVIWLRPNESSNSVGNLLLHLAGNIRQWIVSGVGGAQDVRHRAEEFSTRDGWPAAALLDALDRALDEVDDVLARLEPSALHERRTFQARELTVFEAIFHVVEHFSYHLGQIVLVAKAATPDGIEFYEDAGGKARPVWTSLVRPRSSR